ncbi:MAG: DUF4214 domain-containing protein [Sulfitobacter sp.]
MIVTGNLTLPEGLSAQRFLSEMFELSPEDESPNLRIDIVVDGDRATVTSSASSSLLFDSIENAELIFVGGSGLDATERLISMIVINGANGEAMNITLIEPTTFDEFSAALASGGFDAFNTLLMPQTGPGFFLSYDGSPGGDTIEGFETGDFLNGLIGNDYIRGLGGDDRVNGGSGSDTLMGGTGDDSLIGGEGEDFFVISPNEDNVEVVDLMPIEDWVDFRNFQREQALIELVLDSPTGTVFEGTNVLFFDGEDGLIRIPKDRVILPDLEGTDVSEVLLGSEAAEAILGLIGDDTITGSGGNDTIDGGTGTDTAVYGGSQKQFSVYVDPMGVQVMDRLEGGEGNDTLEDVEYLDFEFGVEPNANGLLDLEMYGRAGELEVDEFADLIELYIAYTGRAPDAVGLLFWAAALEEGMPLDELATIFAGEPEPTAALPDTLSNAEFVEKVYEQVLGRTPDVDGANFWLQVLDEALVSRDEFILEILRGAKADAPDGASQEFSDQQSADKTFLSHKTDIGAEFSIAKGMSDVGNAISVMALFDGTQASLEASFAAINEHFAEALDPENGEFLIQLTGMSAVDFTE